MAITNQDKPTSGSAPARLLNIGSGFSLYIGSLFGLVITPALTGSFVNLARASTAELWSTISTTWATESRTWLDTTSIFDNNSKPTTSISNVSKPV